MRDGLSRLFVGMDRHGMSKDVTLTEMKAEAPAMKAEPQGRFLDVPLGGMRCAACAARIEKVLGRLPGVTASVNLAAERAQLSLSDPTTTPAQVIEAITAAGPVPRASRKCSIANPESLPR